MNNKKAKKRFRVALEKMKITPSVIVYLEFAFNAELEAKDNSWKKKFEKRIYEDEVGIEMLRQWLNEDRITDPDEMVSNEDIKLFLKYKK